MKKLLVIRIEMLRNLLYIKERLIKRLFENKSNLKSLMIKENLLINGVKEVRIAVIRFSIDPLKNKYEYRLKFNKNEFIMIKRDIQ